jgi:asparagine synthase (glutamine-hydrolysing)
MTRSGDRPDPGILDRLEAALRHRGPDGRGRHLRHGTALVHTRLAVIDLYTGDQPIFDPDGRALIANAEIYNDPDLRDALRDTPFRTKSDCEPLLHLYDRFGLDFVEKLRGMYALAIYDPGLRRLIVARDPFGIKQIYYTEAGYGFAFASEPHALIRAGLATAAVSPERRTELLQLKFTTGSETIFPGIRRLLPGELLVIEGGRIVTRRRHPPLGLRGPIRQDAARAKSALDDLLTDCVARHVRADVPCGLFLSGGVDSTALLALMTKVSPRPLVTLTITFPGTGFPDESVEARRLAMLVGAEHHIVEMTDRDFWSLAPKVAAALDDPTTDAAALATYRLGEAACGSLKVILTGEGADELFAGYSRYWRARRPWWLLGRKPRRHGVFDRVDGLRSATAGWRTGLDAAEAREALACRSRLQMVQATDCMEWLPNDLLVKLDRCLMAHGIEGRTPFVDPAVAAFAFTLPDRLKVSGRTGKWLLRTWLAGNLPAARPFSRKIGLNLPTGRWIATQARRIGPLVAGQPGVAKFAAPDAVAALFGDAEKHAQAAWSLLFYALWHSRHIQGVTGEGTAFDILDAATLLK